MTITVRAIPIALLVLAGAARADVVERRGAEPPLRGTVERLHEWGVLLSSENGAEHRVPWDRVRAITFDSRRSDDPALPGFLAAGEELWRARTRLDRGDAVLAEPLFERHAARLLGRTHETALLVAEGLLRCRLARGARADAVVPALETLRLRRAGAGPSPFPALPDVLDPDTGLAPELPPIFEPSRGRDRLRRELAAYDARGDEVVAALAALYRAALEGTAPPAPIDDPGVALLADVVDALGPDADRRERGRSRLLHGLEARPPWGRAWAHLAVGRALLAESGRGRRQEGLLHFAAVAALLERDAPTCAALALADMIRALERDGAADDAAALRAELLRLDPGHPLVRSSA